MKNLFNKDKIIIIMLELIIGCMYSGKSSYLLHILDKHSINNSGKVLYINHKLDKRETEYNENNFSSHSSCIKFSNKIEMISVDKLDNIEFKKYNVIGIDEGQFFDDIYDFVRKSMQYVHFIYVVSLNGDFEQKIFGNVYKLIPFCYNIKYFKANCVYCNKFNEAIFNLRKNNNKEQVLIGGKNLYEASCYYCKELIN